MLCGDVSQVEVPKGNSPLEFFSLCPWDRKGADPSQLPRQDLLMFAPFNPEMGSPYGVSLLRSMPFMAEILIKIYLDPHRAKLGACGKCPFCGHV